MEIILKTRQKKGVTLLMAVLITSVALLFSVAISNLALKEVVLTSLGKNSQLAFYASNSGIECALFYDLHQNIFDTGGSPSFQINCSGQDVNIGRTGSNPWEFTSGDFYLNGVGETSGPCYKLHIEKAYVGNPPYLQTTTESRGYNTCNDVPSRLERALRATY